MWRATTRLRARGPRFLEVPYSAPELPPVPISTDEERRETAIALEAIDKKRETFIRTAARRSFWRGRAADRKDDKGGD